MGAAVALAAVAGGTYAPLRDSAPQPSPV
jgi:hypothetical protein